LATGQFSGFTQRNDHWIPGSSLTNEDGIVNYRNIDYSTPGMCGKTKVVVFFKNTDGNEIGKKIFYLRVMYHGLIKLEVGDGDNIVLDGETTILPDNHYGTQELISAIKKIAKAYGEDFDRGEFDINGKSPEHKELYINDMSLPYGGRFDIDGTLKPSHYEHMFGEEVDMQMNEMNVKQKKWFNQNAKLNGFIRCYAEPEGTPNHYHCSVVDFY
jgi:hypothetical protein